MPDASPLATPVPRLTLAVPTFNRATDLERLLQSLHPQLLTHPEVDLYISDNASTDGTQALVQRFQSLGMALRYHRHHQNIGADANFLSCFRSARGQYFWLCGDDEALLPGALDLISSHLASTPQLDILCLSSFTFRDDYLAEHTPDRFGRRHHTFTSALDFTFAVNIGFTFISGVIVNRARLLQLPHEDPSAFVGTNLVQLSWSLPLLRHHRRSCLLWTRVIASRLDNSGGYSLGTVFGKNLAQVCRRLLPGRPKLSSTILNAALRRWFPSTILAVRQGRNQNMQLDETHRILKPLFRRNPRYWLFVYPALMLPLAPAAAWVRLGLKLGSLADKLRHPLFWRKAT